MWSSSFPDLWSFRRAFTAVPAATAEDPFAIKKASAFACAVTPSASTSLLYAGDAVSRTKPSGKSTIMYPTEYLNS
ncbi:hypothetical protein F442_22518 [Phytophthora nicotianae P10297]|uniref:Uncharacterized protein n=1 Tax=Phytophthora nicotianae P10297 TaxID=1317064 RepID=W2Y1Z6_PHYNI|nr:hypothetical protein F442_22518 [Phytophthora nicotianae P10297]